MDAVHAASAQGVAALSTKVHERLELGPEAAGRARRALAPLARELPGEVLDDVRLLVSELVTNSFRHSGQGQKGSAVLTVDLERERVHVEVEDRGNGVPLRSSKAKPAQRETGWGLNIVERIADRWGVIRSGSTVVWFELSTVRPALRRGAR